MIAHHICEPNESKWECVICGKILNDLWYEEQRKRYLSDMQSIANLDLNNDLSSSLCQIVEIVHFLKTPPWFENQ